MKIAVLVLSVLLLLAAPAVSQIPDDKLIVPGVRIGKWMLQAAIADLVRMNGPAQILRERTPDFVRETIEFHWQEPGLFLTAITFDGRIVEVLFINEVPMGPYAYETDKGIGFRSTRPEILKAYGQPTITKPNRMLGMVDMVYDKIGIDFRIDSIDGTMGSAAVFQPGNAKSLWKF